MIKWNLLLIIGNDKKFRKRTFSFDETAKSLSKISRIAHLSRGRIVWVSCGIGWLQQSCSHNCRIRFTGHDWLMTKLKYFANIWTNYYLFCASYFVVPMKTEFLYSIAICFMNLLISILEIFCWSKNLTNCRILNYASLIPSTTINLNISIGTSFYFNSRQTNFHDYQCTFLHTLIQ